MGRARRAGEAAGCSRSDRPLGYLHEPAAFALHAGTRSAPAAFLLHVGTGADIRLSAGHDSGLGAGRLATHVVPVGALVGGWRATT